MLSPSAPGPSASPSSSQPPSPGPSSSATPSSRPAAAAAAAARPADVPLTGFRSALAHTGIPRAVLTWKPRLPSRNWTIFLSVVGLTSYAVYYDRAECKRIRAEYTERVKHLAQRPLANSLDDVRRVKVIGARWPEDDDEDRALLHFRKYVKPYLVAAAIDYEQMPAPLLGSVSRQVRALVLKARRAALGLDAPDISSYPAAMAAVNPQLAAARDEQERSGGVILVGRPSVKEYLDGLKKGWGHGVGEWDWEKEVEQGLQGDGVFETPETAGPVADVAAQAAELAPAPPAPTAPSLAPKGAFGFLSRPQPVAPPPPSASTAAPAAAAIPPHLHEPPRPLPPQAPLLLVPFTNHLGFLQLPYMFLDLFNERKRVLSGARAAYALIATDDAAPSQSAPAFDALAIAPTQTGVRDLTEAEAQAFDAGVERYYKSSFAKLPSRIEQARKDYYAALAPRLEDARQFNRGEREMTEAEKNSGKVVTEIDLIEERRKKELRWTGMLEGYEIQRPETPVAWDDRWDGWLKVYDVEGSQ